MMNKTLNKAKWPYLLLLFVCMIAASTNSKSTLKLDSRQPVIVHVQIEKQPQVVAPYSDWLVQQSQNEVSQ